MSDMDSVNLNEIELLILSERKETFHSRKIVGIWFMRQLQNL